MGSSEQTIQRRLTYVGLATLASAPILGPGMLLGVVGIFAGKAIRRYRKEGHFFKKSDSKEKPKKDINQEKDNKDSFYEGFLILREYLNKLTAEEKVKVNSVKVYYERKKRFLGIPYGDKSLEIKVGRIDDKPEPRKNIFYRMKDAFYSLFKEEVSIESKGLEKTLQEA